MKKTILILALILASCTADVDVHIVLNDYLFTQIVHTTYGFTPTKPTGKIYTSESTFTMLQITEDHAKEVCKEKTYTSSSYTSNYRVSSVTTYVVINK